MVSTARWQSAQRYERDYWTTLAAHIDRGTVPQLDWYRWRAEQLVLRLRALGLGVLAEGSARVVEVGCGPVGIAGFFPAAKRVAVDPLESSYASNETLTALRNPDVQYRQGMVESLPCSSASYDLAIIENCIDHVRDVQAGMRELKRVLAARGTLYITVNCRSNWGFVVHRALSRLRVDPGHPHTFTPRRLEGLLEEHRFHVLEFENGLEMARRQPAADRGARALAKSALGIDEFVVSAIAQPAGVQ